MSRILISLEIPVLVPWNARSAVANVVSSFCEVLHADGHEVYINQYPFTYVMELRRKGVVGDRTKKASKVIRFFPKRFREFVKDIQLFYQLRKQYAAVKTVPRPDMVIAWVSYGSTIGADLSDHWNVPLYSIYDNPLNEEYTIAFGFRSLFYRYIEWCEKRMLLASKAIIVYSHAVSDHLNSKYAIQAPFFYRQFVDYYKSVHSAPQRKDAHFNFVYIGSFFIWHDLDKLLVAFKRLIKRVPHARLLLVGAGTEFERIKQFSDSMNLQNHVVFTGYADDERLVDILQVADVAIIPGALWFHAPVKLFQYASNGLPVLSVHTPTIAEIANGSDDIRLFDRIENIDRIMEEVIQERSVKRDRSSSLIKWFDEQYGKKAMSAFFKKMFADTR